MISERMQYSSGPEPQNWPRGTLALAREIKRPLFCNPIAILPPEKTPRFIKQRFHFSHASHIQIQFLPRI